MKKLDNDDLDAEIADYSQRAADRINQVKYEYHEERRAKEAASREAKEAVQRLQTVMSENADCLKQWLEQGGEVLNKTAHNNALWAKQNAQAEYKKAYEEGDADAMAKAQELLSKATLAEQQANSTAQKVQNHNLQKYACNNNHKFHSVNLTLIWNNGQKKIHGLWEENLSSRR